MVDFSKKDKNKCPFFIFQNKLGEIAICDHKNFLWSHAEKKTKKNVSIIFNYFREMDLKIIYLDNVWM